ncbi:hypothetical protein RJ641_026918 [Dillenia turbinata]|uniref:Uncharacterized protein n=1 Tax=Dillenia turbinata TaxID=194707 RepID=A0AAN8W4J2_9MAGN
MSTAQIIRESIRVLLLHPTRFHSISMLFFSPFTVSLFVSHLIVHHFPHVPFSTLKFIGHIVGQKGLILPKLLSKTIVHIAICLPSSVTFSLLGRSATAQAVSDSYTGISLDGRRLIMRSGSAWVKLLHTSFWESIVVLGLFGALVAILLTVPKILFSWGICSRMLGILAVICCLGIPFCLVFAHVMVVGNLAKVLTVLESDCSGLESLIKANNHLKGQRNTALIMALSTNVVLRLVECLFELRMLTGMSLWECSLLVSMYSSVLVFDTILTCVFYYTYKPRNL